MIQSSFILHFFRCETDMIVSRRLHTSGIMVSTQSYVGAESQPAQRKKYLSSFLFYTASAVCCWDDDIQRDTAFSRILLRSTGLYLSSRVMDHNRRSLRAHEVKACVRKQHAYLLQQPTEQLRFNSCLLSVLLLPVDPAVSMQKILKRGYKNKLLGLSQRANYTNRATAACRRS
jgi:hypothetical protein